MTVKIASTVATAVFAAITLGIPRTVPHAGGAAFAGAVDLLVHGLPPAILTVALLFMVTGYELD